MLSTCGSRNSSQASAAQLSTSETTETVAAAEPVVQDSKGIVEWDRTVYDFGDVCVADGPLSCSFTLTNKGTEPITIFEVVSSCGCTDVKFTREEIAPGKSATISATYKNEDGPTAFDKTLTVYISGIRRPVILRLRGVVHEKRKSLSELYSEEKLGDFGLKTRVYKTATLKQGLVTSEKASVANLGTKPLKVSFTDVSENLSVSVSPNPIPAGSAATMVYTVKADRKLWGLNTYMATPVLDGKKASAPLEFKTWTQENFAGMSAEEIQSASLPIFDTSTFSFDTVSKGQKVDVIFTCTNNGKSPLKIYKADSDSPAIVQQCITEIGPDQKESVRFTLDTSLLPTGDNVIMISLTTNSPQRPLVNLFVAGEVR